MKTFEYLETHCPDYYKSNKIAELNDLAAYIDGDIALVELVKRQNWLRGFSTGTIQREFDSRMAKAKERALSRQLFEANNDFFNKENQAPRYAICMIQFPEGEPTEATIKLTEDVDDTDDEDIFFYCGAIQGLVRLTKEGAEDFRIVKFINFE